MKLVTFLKQIFRFKKDNPFLLVIIHCYIFLFLAIFQKKNVIAKTSMTTVKHHIFFSWLVWKKYRPQTNGRFERSHVWFNKFVNSLKNQRWKFELESKFEILSESKNDIYFGNAIVHMKSEAHQKLHVKRHKEKAINPPLS